MSSPECTRRKRTRKSSSFTAVVTSTIVVLLASSTSEAFHSITTTGISHNICCSFLDYRRCSSTVLFMGKGDGKNKLHKKKKKSPSTTTPTSSAQQVEQQPARVSSNINVPVRHQILMARMMKESQSTTGSSFRQKKITRTAYRRAWEEEEMEQKALERRRKGQEPDWDVILSRNRTSPLVMVDGYNIINKWSRLKKHMAKGDTSRARQLLVDDLENLSILKGWRIEVVFDGTRRNTAGPLGQSYSATARLDQQTTKSVSKHGVRVVYSGVGTEADTYIEQRCTEAKNVTDGAITGSFIIATDDSMIRMAGQNAGAMCIGADRFVSELKSVKKGVSYQVEAAVAKANGHVIRPESLRGTPIRRFGRGQIVIDDKRNRTKAQVEIPDIHIDIQVEEDENGVPWWAKLPDRKNSRYV